MRTSNCELSIHHIERKIPDQEPVIPNKPIYNIALLESLQWLILMRMVFDIMYNVLILMTGSFQNKKS